MAGPTSLGARNVRRMRRTVTAVLALAALVPLSACGGDGKAGARPTNDDFTQGAESAPPAPQTKNIPWGQPAEVLGTNLRKMRVTPVGVLYSRGAPKATDKPENGWYVAIAIRAEAIGSPEAVAGGLGGGGFQWRGNSESIDSSDGTAPTAAWVGRVNHFGVDSPIEPGSPEVGIETFDVPAKGGRLVYLSPEDNSITSWNIPASDQGTGLEKVRKSIKLFS